MLQIITLERKQRFLLRIVYLKYVAFIVNSWGIIIVSLVRLAFRGLVQKVSLIKLVTNHLERNATVKRISFKIALHDNSVSVENLPLLFLKSFVYFRGLYGVAAEVVRTDALSPREPSLKGEMC